ncbi:MAG: type II toxin-antitoxin system Phd/YefM family antitoxin [Akkermansiaceae bacterium]|jgi:prevent-host-death family protein|nr:type II toxin-antitoxin system Phd/YefM family antitoxin [Akkermansiaceae bacterium]
MNVRQISISEFKAHCTEEIRAVEKGDLLLELTRHGKTVAVVQSPSVAPSAPTLENWVCSGKGTVTFAPSYDPAAPAFEPEDWES